MSGEGQSVKAIGINKEHGREKGDPNTHSDFFGFRVSSLSIHSTNTNCLRGLTRTAFRTKGMQNAVFGKY